MERENPLPFMENSIKNFHFVFLNPSLGIANQNLLCSTPSDVNDDTLRQNKYEKRHRRKQRATLCCSHLLCVC